MTAGEFIIIVVFGGIIVSVAVVFVLCVAGAIFEHRHNKSGGRPWCSITIGTMEGRSIGLKHVMSAARYQEQVDKLRSNGVQVPTLIPREEHY